MISTSGKSPSTLIPGQRFLLKGSPSLLEESQPVIRLFPRILYTEVHQNAPGDTTVQLGSYNLNLPGEGFRFSPAGPLLKIEAGGSAGLLYGLISLVRRSTGEMVMTDPDCFRVEHPAFEYRGFMLDSVRHFFKTEEIFRILDLCLILRLNRFHWHLTDDQGWRIESKVYPALHETGGQRKPFRGDKDSCSGYYTGEDINRVVAYAACRGITVIPEIDMPGHVSALLSAYPHLACKGKKRPVPRRPGIYHDVLCPGNNEVYPFMKEILKEVSSLFPGPWIHLGGDEVSPRRWARCSRCRALMQRNNLHNVFELQGYFMNEMIRTIEALGKQAIVWNDAITPEAASKEAELDPRAVIQYWIEKGGAPRSRRVFEQGRRMIFSDFWHLYLDYPHGMTRLKKTQTYAPGFTPEKGKKTASPLGLEAPLWTEYVTTPEKLYRMILPRLYAAAETGWTGESDPDYDGFLERIRILDALCRTLGYEGTPISQADPGRMRSFFQVTRFILTALSRIRF